MWQLFEFLAWAISALLIGWMVWDMLRVGQATTEAELLSSREGVDELFAEQNKQGR